MEFVVAWFWLVKLGLSLITLGVLYVTLWKHEGKNAIWNFFALAMIIIMVISPVKIKPKTDKVNLRQTILIEQTKVLPEKKTDNRFNDSTNIVGITKTDLK